MITGPGIITRGYGTKTVVARGYTFIQQVINTVVDAGRRIAYGGANAVKKTKDYVLEQWRKIAVYGKLAAKDSTYENLNQMSGYEEHVVDNNVIDVQVETVQNVKESTEIEVSGKIIR